MQTLRSFHQRIAEINAKASREHQRKKELGEKHRRDTYAFAFRWGIRGGNGHFPKSDYRNIPQVVGRVKQRISYLQGLGYGSINSPEQLSRAEANLERDRSGWVTDTGMTKESIIKMQETGGRNDIMNVIDFRERLGLISSGVI